MYKHKNRIIEMKLTFIILLMFSCALNLDAGNKESKKADKLFAIGDYQGAIDMYDLALEKEEDPAEKALYRYRIGESYHRLNRPDKAEKYLNDAIKKGYMSAEVYLLLGDVQLKLGKTDDALSSYESYSLANPGDNLIPVKIASVKFAKENQQNLSLFKLEELSTKVNSNQNEFGVSYFNESLIFSTTKVVSEVEEEEEDKDANRFDDRVVPEKKQKAQSYIKGGLKQTLVMLSVGSNGNYGRAIEIAELNKMKDFADDGVMIYDPYSKQAYYTRLEGKKAYIYSLQLVSNQWKKNSKIEVQSQGEPIGHPFMTPEGDRIYFTSRMPGGKGKSDIWYITKIGDTWNSVPVNAGDNINTAGNEVYPHISDGYFFFASDGRIGMGGLDIYVAKITSSGFERPINLGVPFNSPADDYNLSIRLDKKEGLLVSSRNTKRGDDVFRFEGFPSNLTIIGKVKDINTNAPISNVSLELFIEKKSLNKVVSDQNGDFIIPVRPNVTYRLVASVAGYSSAEKMFTSPNDLYVRINKESGIDLDFALQANAAVISGKAYDIQTLTPLEGAIVSLIAGGKVQQTTRVDPSGIYKFANLTNNTDYTLRIDPKGYFFDNKNIHIVNSSQQFEYNKNNGYDMDFTLQKYDVDKEIIIPGIYFQADKANILTESYKELDHLAQMFNQNKHCYILLKGYVDVGIKSDIATKLSQLRVTAVRDYLISKKVNPSQISTKAMGRQNPLVRNPRTDDERMLNNRITYTVTRVDAVKELDYSTPTFPSTSTPDVSQTKPKTPSSSTSSQQSSSAQQQTTKPVQQQTTQPAQQQQTQTANTADPTKLPFIVQVAALGSLDMGKPEFAKIRTQLGLEVRYELVDGKYKYYVGGFETLTEAKDVAQKLESIGIKGAWAKHR
ncbi:MAG: carboxypeptidase regulatory-like domain-containing protein [Prevotellaceae bacterium]|nr:carboxypeptidase regulatory-like domain-containing protein [Prevotellaceae bacterium]